MYRTHWECYSYDEIVGIGEQIETSTELQAIQLANTFIKKMMIPA